MNHRTASKARIRSVGRAVVRAVAGATAALAGAAIALSAASDRTADRAPDSSFVWPLDAEPSISSNFCEYREGHLHAGIDIRSYGSEGVPCLAVGDGYVSRMRASCEGYGKALYVQLASGVTLVYAHLAEFRPDLESELQSAQARGGSFTVDVRFPKESFAVTKGEIIGYSGSTGGTAPHLHFEVRDVGENPLNPFSNGFSLEDRLNPSIERIEFSPLSPDARINGRCWPVELRAEEVGVGRYAVSDTLYLIGEVGVSLEAFDRLNRKSGRLAPYRLSLLVDDSVVTDVRLERFSFSHTDQVDLLYDIARVRTEKEFFFRLFQSAGESLWNREFRRGGALSPAATVSRGRTPGERDSLHVGVVEVADFEGNRAEISFRFYSDSDRPLPRPAWARVEHGRARDLPGFFFRNGFVSTRRALVDERLPAPRAAPGELETTAHIDGYRLSNVYSASDLLDGPFAVSRGEAGGRGTVSLVGVAAGRPTSVNVPEFSFQLIVGARSLYADQVFYVSSGVESAKAANPAELVPRAAAVRIGPYSLALRADVEIRFVAERFDSASAIYRLNERKSEWVFYESTVDRGIVSTTVRRPGVYAVFSDEYGPRIRTPFVRTWKSYATGETRPEIVVPIEDTGSGVDHRVTTVSLAGKDQIAYWDNRSKKLLVVVRDPNIMGPRAIVIDAFDKIGNRSRLSMTIDIPNTSQSQDTE